LDAGYHFLIHCIPFGFRYRSSVGLVEIQMERLVISQGQEEGSTDVSSSNEDSPAALEVASTDLGVVPLLG
jgi:hypothetical protein